MIFRDDEEDGKPLLDGWVEIQPYAYGLSFHDIVGAMGQLDEAQELGQDYSGLITRAGANVPNLEAGDRVMALTLHGHFSSRVRVPWTNVVPIPYDMPFSEASSIGAAYGTAYYAMFEAARLEAGETVLIHAATRGLGQACIMLAQWKGVNILTTASTAEKRTSLKDTYGISEANVFYSCDASFAPAVMSATNHKGVDAVINSLAGPLLQASLGVLAPHGRFVEVGKRDIHRNMALEMGSFRKAVSFTAVDMTLPPKDRARLKPDATYLVIGGLAGLGRSIAWWLIGVGAKNIILLSRHAPSSPYAQPLQEDSAAVGVKVKALDCDVADMTSLKVALAECGKTMPPVRGLIHGGMVLNDSILERMTAAQWKTALDPKVAGTRNIDLLFSSPASLDFFIMLSSFVGVNGNPSQGNYSAGGAFQDAVARRRAARGLPCVTFDLGPVKGVGFVAEAGKSAASKLLEADHFRPIEEANLHQLMDYAVRVPIRSVRTAQVIAGLAGKGLGKPNTSTPWTREQRFAKLSGDDEALSGVNPGDATPGNAVGSAAANLKQNLASAQGIEEVAEIMEKAVISKIADMFAVPEEDIEADRPLSKYGVDSLVAVELRN
ncbi:beta-ketoacyl synthase domain-containing protein [Seiridium cupressi]